MRSLNWTKDEDSILAVINHLYNDPYGLVIQKALENHRLFPFQSSITAPSVPSSSFTGLEQRKSQFGGQCDSFPIPYLSQNQAPFPLRTTKQVIDRVLWQERTQNEIFKREAIESQSRFAPYLLEFSQWKTRDSNKRVHKEKMEFEDEVKKEKVHRSSDQKGGFWSWVEKKEALMMDTISLSIDRDDSVGIKDERNCERKGLEDRKPSLEVDDKEISSAINERIKEDKDTSYDREGIFFGKKMFFSNGARQTWWEALAPPTSSSSSSRVHTKHIPSIAASDTNLESSLGLDQNPSQVTLII